MGDKDLVMESSTDTVEQIREGLGLAPETPAPAAETPADTPADTTPETPAGETPADTPAVDVAPEAVADTPVVDEPARDPATGQFVAAPAKRKPNPAQARIDELTRKQNDERAARTVAETERDALKRRLDELTAGKPAEKPAPTAPATQVEIPPDQTIAATYAAKRTALGAEPKQDDFEDYLEFRRAERGYDRKLATLDAEESIAQQGAADRVRIATQEATRAVQQQYATYEEQRIAAAARHADWNDVMQAGNTLEFKGKPYADDIQRAIIETADAEVVYYIAKHPEELTTIQSQKSVHAALAHLGRVSAKAAAEATTTPKPAGATQTGPATHVATATATKPVSRAPEPQGTVLGGSSTAPATTLETAKDQAEYNRIRNAQERAKRGR